MLIKQVFAICGPAGSRGLADEPFIRGMMTPPAHRGPNAEGVHCQPAGTPGHRRPAIMDPEGGDQPIHDEGGGRCIVANGESYNKGRRTGMMRFHFQYRGIGAWRGRLGNIGGSNWEMSG